MIGLDTNVIVRYLAQDDPIQSRSATQIVERILCEEPPGFVSLVAMAETSWVLERSYRLTDREIANAIELLLRADSIFIESEQEVFTAMVALRSGRGSFADALIGALGVKAGCAYTFTFDRKAARLQPPALPLQMPFHVPRAMFGT